MVGATDPWQLRGNFSPRSAKAFPPSRPGFADAGQGPVSLDETIKGAINRAKGVFRECCYSAGIEDGISRVPQTASGYMNFCCCAVYDGRRSYLGLGPAFEYPQECTKKVIAEGITVSEAFAPISGKPGIGYEEGIIGWLTGGRINRKDYTKQAVEMAKIQIDNPELY